MEIVVTGLLGRGRASKSGLSSVQISSQRSASSVLVSKPLHDQYAIDNFSISNEFTSKMLVIYLYFASNLLVNAQFVFIKFYWFEFL